MNASELARVSLGFILGPAVGLALLGIGWCVPRVFEQGAVTFGSCWGSGDVVLFVGSMGALVAYPAMVLFGIPLFFLFRKRGWLTWWQVSLGGFLVGALSMLAFALYVGTLSGGLEYVLLFCGVGLCSGLAFWAIAVFRNRALTPGSRGDAPQAARA